VTEKTIDILHIADLHLSGSEKEYSLEVLSEIISRADGSRCILMSGDIFDSFRDVALLKNEFREITGKFPGEIIYIPGNHESLGIKKNESLDAFDFGKVRFSSRIPFDFFTLDFNGIEIEFLTIPHQKDCSSYRQWSLPPKKAPFRIALCHGNISELIEYTGPGDEEGAESIDSELFHFHGCDYAALGHIHSHRTASYRECTLAYPGSARVWRKGENGEHGMYRIKIDAALSSFFEPIQNAGQYHKAVLPVLFECESTDLPGDWERFQKNDFVEIELQGLVEDEKKVPQLEERIRNQLKKKVRKLEIDRNKILPFPGISEVSIVKQFLKEWESRRPDDASQYEIWYRSRQIALAEIKEILEKRS